MIHLKNPIFLALDVDSPESAEKLALSLSPYIGGFKLGPRLLMRTSPVFVQNMSKLAPIFIDNKYFDIPSTMLSAVKASFEIGASFATVHASAGAEALSELAKLEVELNQVRPFKILAITVLTSMKSPEQPPFLQNISITNQVSQLAELSLSSGITGLVCSPEDLAHLKRKFPQSYLVCPGIRSTTDKGDDQKRTLTAKEALDLGASALVIGRPILQSANPTQAVQNILKEVGF